MNLDTEGQNNKKNFDTNTTRMNGGEKDGSMGRKQNGMEREILEAGRSGDKWVGRKVVGMWGEEER